MQISASHLAARFYVSAGWTEEAVQQLLTEKKVVELRTSEMDQSCNYFACYNVGQSVCFKASELAKHVFTGMPYDDRKTFPQAVLLEDGRIVHDYTWTQ